MLRLKRLIMIAFMAGLLGCGTGFSDPPVSPVVVTLDASGIGLTGSQLNARVNPNGGDTVVWFEWGPDAAYGNTTEPRSIGSGRDQLTIFHRISGLQTYQTYFYRAVAENEIGQVVGQKRSFTTLPPEPPLVMTEPATDITQRTVTLLGTVNPMKSNAFGRFEWGTSAAYGQETGEQYLGSGDTSVQFSMSLTGLQPGTTYHYRAIGRGDGGEAIGQDELFSTDPDDSQTYTLAVTRIGTGSGSVDSSPGGINCGPDCSEMYASDTAVILTATPEDGSAFAGWVGDPGCGSTVIMDGDKNCSAVFDAQASLSLVAWYAMDQANGALVVDSSGNGRSATSDGAMWVTGQAGYGNALFFDGNDFVRADSNYPGLLLTHMTLMAWINPAATADWQPIVRKGANGFLNYRLEVGFDGYLYFSFDTTAGTHHSLRSAVTVPNDVWTHVAATYDGVTIRLYINGGETGQMAASGNPKTDSTQELYIGRNYDQDQWYIGVLDEVKLFNQALTAAEIQAEIAP